MILLDTHVVAWLHEGDTRRFPNGVRRLVDSEDLAVSPLVGLELQYLYEIGRASLSAEAVLAALGRVLGLRVVDCSLGELVGHAVGNDWTRDPFDRLIVAHSSLEQAPLLTADRTIRAHHPLAVWDEPSPGGS